MITLHRCFSLVKSKRSRRIALPLAILIGLFLPNMPSIPILSLGRVFASVRGFLSHPKPAQMMGEQHVVHIPYFTTSDGMASILTLNNNMTERATAAVTLFNMKGESLALPPIDLAPQLPARFDLGQLVKSHDFASGNVQISFNGMSMGITSQISVISPGRRVAFESVEGEAMDFSSSRLDGILWLPNAETKGRIALTNTTAAPLSLTALAGKGQEHEERTLSLNPHETDLIDARQFLGSRQDSPFPATLLTLQHSGSPGALMVTGFAVDEETGFSCNLPFVDRSTSVSAHLAGAHVRIGTPNPNEGFPAGTRFSAPLVLANAGDQQTQVTVSLDYTTNSVPHRVQVGLASLTPGQIRLFDLANALAARGIQGPLDNAGVDVTYTSPPGAIIGRLTSIDQTGDFAFDVPVKDPLAEMMRVSGVYPWRLDDGFTTVVHLKNTVNKPVHALVQVRYEGGTYNLERIPLAPFQTIAIDIGALRDGQRMDIRGSVMPTNVASGQIIWFEEDTGSLIGRAEVANIPGGVASSFSCPGACPCQPSYFSSSMTPSSATGAVGTTCQFLANETRRDCNGVTYGPYNRTSDSTWTSSNTSVATVSVGLTSCLSPGSAGITAQFQAVIYGGLGGPCDQHIVNPTNGGNMQVTPTVTGSGPNTVVLDSSGHDGVDKSIQITANGTPSGGTYSWTTNSPKVTLSNASSATVTVTSAQMSTSRGDVTVTVTYTVNNQSATATQQMTVLKPSSLSVSSSTPDSTGHTCDPSISVENSNCQASGFTGNGTYTSYLRTITYDIRDQFDPPQKISGFNMFISESFTPRSGQCAGGAQVTGSGVGQTISDCFFFCSETCRTGGTCNVSSTQTLLVNGFTVATKSVTWTCSDASVQ